MKKAYRDIKNVVDTANAEDKIEEKEGVVERCWRKKMDIPDIADISGLSLNEVSLIIEKLKEKEK